MNKIWERIKEEYGLSYVMYDYGDARFGRDCFGVYFSFKYSQWKEDTYDCVVDFLLGGIGDEYWEIVELLEREKVVLHYYPQEGVIDLIYHKEGGMPTHFTITLNKVEGSVLSHIEGEITKHQILTLF